MENKLTPKQQKRQQEREIIDEYHKLVTEQALEIGNQRHCHTLN